MRKLLRFIVAIFGVGLALFHAIILLVEYIAGDDLTHDSMAWQFILTWWRWLMFSRNCG